MLPNGWEKLSEEQRILARKRAGKSLSNNIKNGITKSSFLGKNHSIKTKEKISKARQNSPITSNGNRCKYYKLFCPLENEEVTVQGRWELFIALKLNESNVLWTKNYKEHNFEYILPNETQIRTYYPDFYLPEFNLYLEVKSLYDHWNKVKPLKKMEIIKSYNPKVKFLLILKDDIKKLGFNHHNKYEEYLSDIKQKELAEIKKEEIKKSKENKLKKKQIEYELKYKTLFDNFFNSNKFDINIFLKFGWVVFLSKEFNMSHTNIRRIMKKYYPDKLKIFYKRK